jgi:hypothetical protein
MQRKMWSSNWLLLHMGLGLLWACVLASRADGATGGATAGQIILMLLVGGWLPSTALAIWQVSRRRWRSLWASDLLWAGVLVLAACTVYLPIFFFNVAWFLPLALLPRGTLTEMIMRRLARGSLRP